MTVEGSHWLEMKPRIRGWGTDCEVLEPEELRREIAEDMQAAELYRGGRDPIMEVIGGYCGGPENGVEQHDHYIYGGPKR